MNDIDFYKLFEFSDRTTSKVNQQYLYDKLLTNTPTKPFEEQEKMIDFFLENKTKRIEAQLILSALNEKEAFLLPNLFFEENIQPQKWFSLIKILPFVSLLLLIITFFIQKCENCQYEIKDIVKNKGAFQQYFVKFLRNTLKISN